MQPHLEQQDLDQHDSIRAVSYANGILRLLDQRELPFNETYVECRNAQDVSVAIRDLVVRGAPAIGIAAAWGVVLQAGLLDNAGESISAASLDNAINGLNAARPTAVNLAWALAAHACRGRCAPRSAPLAALAAEARAI